MKIQLIRHATMLIYVNGKKILVDPMLSPQGTMEAIPNVANQNNNPLVELPIEIHKITNIDAILLTHTHRDHLDSTAIELLPKYIPVFCQPEDTKKIQSEGFLSIYPIQEFLIWDGITFNRTKGQHGDKEMAEKMGPSSGFIITTNNEPSIYIMGDTIWCSDLEKSLSLYKPQIVICFAGAAQFSTGNPITMTAQDIYHVCRKSPNSKIIVTHMEAWNHCSLSRKELKDFLVKKSLNNQVCIPNDGEIITY